MKKVTCFSAVAALVFTVVAGSALANQTTVSGGYAQSDYQGVVNKAKGLNLKLYQEWDDSPLGAIGSFTHTEKSGFGGAPGYNKMQYNSIAVGPAYRISDWASVYGLLGVGHGRFSNNSLKDGNDKRSNSDYGVTYGAGLQFNPMQNVALDFSYEKSRIRSVDIGTFVVGAGYTF
ncbi:outer membrane protein OmpX [Candidatus Fukatsuia symbiotica]|uniref:Outer membrane protein X n=1 Tax=Candidatus Fukatsuia symbiotica TaxID=1878942 RepID=A0A2U8I8T5_9GAMM|nr:outer membrane protein OmpX [Candidatus Fukatsuia symbiotica]AWK14475.1 outer membrane protein OmpX [Candidatus Fukatsuia symbiotica]MEA9444758.1 outer membrane protein OmpX [Candidatus Fukatsuia symbiotica]